MKQPNVLSMPSGTKCLPLISRKRSLLSKELTQSPQAMEDISRPWSDSLAGRMWQRTPGGWDSSRTMEIVTADSSLPETSSGPGRRWDSQNRHSLCPADAAFLQHVRSEPWWKASRISIRLGISTDEVEVQRSSQRWFMIPQGGWCPTVRLGAGRDFSPVRFF